MGQPDRLSESEAQTAPPGRAIRSARTVGLARAGAEREGDVSPRVDEWRGGRQMQDDAADRDDDMDAELEQPLAERGHLRTGAGRARGPQPEFLQEDVRRRGAEQGAEREDVAADRATVFDPQTAQCCSPPPARPPPWENAPPSA